MDKPGDTRSKCYIVSHTHWDREWYQTFQGFRKRLVFLVDELLEVLERDPSFRCFHLDGQTVPLEDYLEIRPEQRERLEKLIRERRLLVGPWYVMPDEFLVSGEALVRNLQVGTDLARSFGAEPMRNGYLVDIFGHNSQMPQILRGFGIRSATLYRGIGDFPGNAFLWSAPEGSEVAVFKLDRERSYSNFYFAVRWPFEDRDYDMDEVVARMRELLDFSRERAVTPAILFLDGVDHLEIEPGLPQIVEHLNRAFQDAEFVHGSLEEYEEAFRKYQPELHRIQGELYSLGRRGVNNQLLKNVLSSMVHLKQLNDECERTLTRWAEPFAAAAHPAAVLSAAGHSAAAAAAAAANAESAAGAAPHPSAGRDWAGFFCMAWKLLLQNQAHDSICGCSISRVHRDNEFRFDQVRDIAHEIVESSLGDIASAVDTRPLEKPFTLVLFNAGQRPYSGVVEAEVELPAGSSQSLRLWDANGREIPFQLLSVERDATKKLVRYRRLIRFPSVDRYRVALETSLPAVGYTTYGYERWRIEGPGFGEYSYREFTEPRRHVGSFRSGAYQWENEYLRLSVSPSGTLTVEDKRNGRTFSGLLVFEDSGDVGDGWKYRKPNRDSVVNSAGSSFSVSVENDGPLLLEIALRHRLEVPTTSHLSYGRSKQCTRLEITTYVAMHRRSSLLAFRTVVNNKAVNHRLRVLFPTEIQTEDFLCATPFDLQSRSIEKPDTSKYVEKETGVFPNQGVVVLQEASGGIALFNKGLYEVEVTEDPSHTVALTLFRSFETEVGITAPDPMDSPAARSGEESAGSHLPKELPYERVGRLMRLLAFDYALYFPEADEDASDILVRGMDWRAGIAGRCFAAAGGTHPPELSLPPLQPSRPRPDSSRPTSDPLHLPMEASFLRIDIPSVVLSSYRRNREGMTVLRLYNPGLQSQEGRIEIFSPIEACYRLDLAERIVDEVDHDGHGVNFKVTSGQIATLGFLMREGG